MAQCECGVRVPDAHDREQMAEHRRWHGAWAHGIPVGRALAGEGDRLVCVTLAGTAAAINLAYSMARLFRRELGYDFAGWPRYTRGLRQSTEHRHDHLRCYVAVRERRAVGCLIASDVHEAARLPVVEAAGVPLVGVAGLRPSVDRLFVCADHRRAGIGADLVRELAQDSQTALAEIAWQTPLTAGGEALARRFCTREGTILIA